MVSGVRKLIGAAAVAMVLVATAGASGESREFDDSATYPFRVTCGERIFGVSALEQPGGVEHRDSGIGRAVRRISKNFAPEFGGEPSGWRILGRTRKKVELAAGEPPMPWLLLGRNTRFSRGPGWDMLELDSGCYPFAVSNRGGPAIWHVHRSDLPLAQAATTFTALVEEQSCASGQDASDRISEPVIRYGTETVGIAFFVRPLRGPQYCPGNPPAEVEVRLEEPLGGRGLDDLGVFPPVSLPTVPPIDLSTATRIAEEVLAERFPSFRDPDRITFGCIEGETPTEADCIAIWATKRLAFDGQVFVTRDDAAGGVYRWSYELVRTDRRCGGGAKCNETLTGEGISSIP